MEINAQLAAMAPTLNFLRNRTRGTMFTSLFVISLVLFFLGLFSGLAIYMRRELEKVQEEFEFIIYLPDQGGPEKLKGFDGWLKGQPWVRELRFVSKEDAAKTFKKAYGEHSMDLMDGVNPLPASYNVQIRPEWIQSDSIAAIEARVLGQDQLRIMDTDYPIDRIEKLKANLNEQVRFAWGAGVIVLLVAFFIVNSTVRLAIYSQRLMIRSMQLIGATGGFIRRPFLRMGLFQGVLGGVIADGLLLGLSWVASGSAMDFPTVSEMLSRPDFLLMLGGIILFGGLIGWLSSLWAVSRFLNKNLDQLM